MRLQERDGDPHCSLDPFGRAPINSISTCNWGLKKEDRIFTSVAGSPNRPSYVVVADGHCGSLAAQTCVNEIKRNLPHILESMGRIPLWDDHTGLEEYAASLRHALCQLFVSLNDQLAVTGRSGSSLTLAVLTGWLLTVANVGDSTAMLDNGCDFTELTTSHRIDTNQGERVRVESLGVSVFPGPSQRACRGAACPAGPLRLWPAGSPMGFKNSRSLGDAAGGPSLLPHPNIKQVLVPHSGARLVVASDGLWDAVPLDGVARLSRSSGIKACAAALTGAASSRMSSAVRKAVPDDISVVILDLMPNHLINFLDVVALAHPSRTASPASKSATPAANGASPNQTLAQVLSRMGLEAPQGASAQPPAAARVLPIQGVRILADVDMAATPAPQHEPPFQATRPGAQEAFRSDSAQSLSGADADRLRHACRKQLQDGAVCSFPASNQPIVLCEDKVARDPCVVALQEALPLLGKVVSPVGPAETSQLVEKGNLAMSRRLASHMGRLGAWLRPGLSR
eukprot:jgi/Botrbrau1/22777/Bobra.0132s0104.1